LIICFSIFLGFNVQQVYMPPTNRSFAFVRFLTRSDAEAALIFCRGKYDASFYKYDPQKRYINPPRTRVHRVRQEKQVTEPKLKRPVDLPVREDKRVEDSKRKRGDEPREEERVEEREPKKTRVHHAQPVREEKEVKEAEQGDSKSKGGEGSEGSGARRF
ncbi:hypothetical protein MKX03_002001, partial [Papaver bracteatum]